MPQLTSPVHAALVDAVISFLSIQTRFDKAIKRCRPPLPRFSLALALAAFFFATLPAATAQGLPKTEEANLAGNEVNLENSLKGNTGVLILGFSRKSGDQAREWTKALLTEFSADPSIAIFEMPILESMPRFVRGMALRSIKNASSPVEREHFVPVFHNEALWKQVAQFSEADDAYIVVVDRDQKIVFREHGPEGKRKAEVIGKIHEIASAPHGDEPATGK